MSKQPLHDAKCHTCGKACQVPFVPNGTRPIFCSYCFGRTTHKGAGSQQDQGKVMARISSIESKLNDLLATLADES